MEEWSNRACLGYVIKAMKEMGKTDEEIQDTINQIKKQFDVKTIEEAAEIFNKSSFY